MRHGISTSTFAAAFLLGLSLLFTPAMAQQSVGIFESHTDVGPVRHAGDAVYDEETQEYEISGSGTNVWFDHDEFHFVWRRLEGDFIVRAHGGFVDDEGYQHRKMGWMARSDLDADAAYVDAAVHGNGLASLQYRKRDGDNTEEVQSSVVAPDVIQLERTGDTFIMSVARFGEPFERVEVRDVSLDDDLYVGLFVCSHDENVVEKAIFQNVRIVIPPDEGYTPYRDYIGSNLELLDVQTGRRRVMHRSDESLQAPNWTPDGRALIYNSNGKLYRFDLKTGGSKVVDTGFATRNNNDHVLSFDGKMLGISHHAEENGGQSLIYTLPAEGGTPVQITPTGPSYLHGWSPDGEYVTYTAQRQGDYDVYKMPSDGNGEEIRLTTSPGLDDGSEFSPDGKYIYFNSARSGSMEIWRMKPDGSDQEQITRDEFNNWFPHVSPDGKWILFLSYLPDVDPSDHPFYKQVYLRLMPASGGAPKVAAYLYGGQGTINVPSWSPGSTHVAFVSNSDIH